MSASKFFLVVSMLSMGILAACSESNTYPITGAEVSQDDPVRQMSTSGMVLRGEAR